MYGYIYLTRMYSLINAAIFFVRCFVRVVKSHSAKQVPSNIHTAVESDSGSESRACQRNPIGPISLNRVHPNSVQKTTHEPLR